MILQTCPVCQSAAYVDLGAYRNESPVLEGLTKRICTVCGMVFAAPMPSPEVWNTYNASYFETAHGSTTDSPRARVFRHGLAKVRVAQVIDQIGSTKPAMRVLEVGAGYGEFMDAYVAKRPSTSYAVVDTDEIARNMLLARGASVYSELCHVPQDRDLLVLSHVLEHTRDPGGFLRACLQCVVPGGHVFIDVPCRDDLYKDGDEPHLLFFDKPAMTRLLADVGLTCIEIGYYGQTHNALIREGARSQRVTRALNGLRRLWAHATGAGPKTVPKAERPVLTPFAADREQTKPARWLRAKAVK